MDPERNLFVGSSLNLDSTLTRCASAPFTVSNALQMNSGERRSLQKGVLIPNLESRDIAGRSRLAYYRLLLVKVATFDVVFGPDPWQGEPR